ncbi:MAG: bifunctional riboflavin kinase/FAD synthetase [Armatimonadetes bacterium]|nr:bifunctional riboflavin kinase/FAD synthetase [Armatimonadota bacterium]
MNIALLTNKISQTQGRPDSRFARGWDRICLGSGILQDDAMLVHFGVDLLHPEWQEAVVCIGTFDSVHRGHRALIERSVAIAAEERVPSVVVTFDRHPAATLAPEKCPPAIATLEQNVWRMREAGASVCVILAFDHHLAEMTATDFLNHILINKLRAKQLVVGHDFALGKGREGTTDWLAQHLPTEVLEPVTHQGERVSSSAIRRAIAEGRVADAAEIHGRPYSVRGVVVKGQQLGRTIGFPTLNIARSSAQIVPQDGVYAGVAHTRTGKFAAAISVGMRPVVQGKARTIEAYLLDYPGDELYGQTVEVGFHHHLRDEWSFPSLEELKVQIERDVAETRERITPILS